MLLRRVTQRHRWLLTALVAMGAAVGGVSPGAVALERPDVADRAPAQELGWPATVTTALWLGDSTAFEAAPGVVAALGAGGVATRSFAYPGVSLAVDDFLPEGESWIRDRLGPLLESDPADVVFWQLSLLDTLSTRQVLEVKHRGFVDLALQQHGYVVFVIPPPLRAGASPLGLDWDGLTDLVVEIAEDHRGRVFVVDTSSVWGVEYVEFTPDGRAIRKPDGVHTCQAGVFALGNLLVNWLAEHFAGPRPVDPASIPIDWWGDERFDDPPGACDRRAAPAPAPA